MDPAKLIYMKNKYDGESRAVASERGGKGNAKYVTVVVLSNFLIFTEGDELLLPDMFIVGKRQMMRGKTKRRFVFKLPPEELRNSLRTYV